MGGDRFDRHIETTLDTVGLAGVVDGTGEMWEVMVADDPQWGGGSGVNSRSQYQRIDHRGHCHLVILAYADLGQEAEQRFVDS